MFCKGGIVHLREFFLPLKEIGHLLLIPFVAFLLEKPLITSHEFVEDACSQKTVARRISQLEDRLVLFARCNFRSASHIGNDGLPRLDRKGIILPLFCVLWKLLQRKLNFLRDKKRFT